MKNLKLITLTSLLAIGILANCHKREIGGNQANGAILGQLVGGLGKGNCAISINGIGLAYGAVINTAINNGGSLSSLYQNSTLKAAYISGTSGAVTSVTTFGQTEFESVMGKAISQINGNYTSYSLVAYNSKYDAFFGTSSIWTDAMRNVTIAYTKAFLDSFGPLGDVAIGQTTTANTNYSSLSTYQKSVLNAYIASASTSAGAGATFCDTWTEVFNSTTCATTIGTSNYATYAAGLASAVASAALPVRTSGTAALACSRIPKASCSFSGLTTFGLNKDVEGIARQYDVVMNTAECRKSSSNVPQALARMMLRGSPPEVNVATLLPTGLFDYKTSSFNGVYNSATNNSTSSIDATTTVLPIKAYPKFGSLVSLGFGALMPMKDGSAAATSYGTDFSTQGSNIVVKAIDDCSTIGLGTGPTPTAPNAYGKELSSAQEIVYAFSDNGIAASAYAKLYSNAGSFDSITYGAPSQSDAVACNSALRSKTAVPALIGGKISSIQATSGDGSATSLLSLCVYGGTDATQRLYLRTALTGSSTSGLIGSGVLPSTAAISSGTAGTGAVGDCSSAAINAAGVFGETGLKSFTTASTGFPNGN